MLSLINSKIYYIFMKLKVYLFSSKRITGHVLTVDGGRKLTSSGYTHW